MLTQSSLIALVQLSRRIAEVTELPSSQRTDCIVENEAEFLALKR